METNIANETVFLSQKWIAFKHDTFYRIAKINGSLEVVSQPHIERGNQFYGTSEANCKAFAKANEAKLLAILPEEGEAV